MWWCAYGGVHLLSPLSGSALAIVLSRWTNCGSCLVSWLPTSHEFVVFISLDLRRRLWLADSSDP